MNEKELLKIIEENKNNNTRINIKEIASQMNISERSINYFLKKEGLREKYDVFTQLSRAI